MTLRFHSSRLSPHLKKIKKQLKKKRVQTITEDSLKIEEQNLIEKIRTETIKRNRNNITRTEAYFHFYQQFPEIHWAFLGHMVSRNGGWNMTDLKGELLTKLLPKKERENFFSFLERGNWLIFQDVYPQMLLYKESIKRQMNLFYLLPIFGVSKFMKVVWDYYMEEKEDYLLAFALVVNEQSYLENRVIQNSFYKKNVLESIEFKLQELLSLNQILFPYKSNRKTMLMGQTINHFASLHERILLGKRLYHLLFDSELYPAFFKWALQQPHTGSRKDFWPQLFNNVNESIPGKLYKRRIKNCSLKSGSHRIFSPPLQFAWKDVHHDPAEKGDWYKDWRVVHYLEKYNEKVNGDIKNDYCETLEKIELSLVAKETFF
ncbi:hypothetical protein J2S74_005228 [Evansella vedderi]|uniref:DUF2515 domain-containing protein n=1 Tax=Evansella vedderi TaxID=38282 RepID=A0ABU0A2P8_9BACI|nr:DUF2515 family protein [Evansella vedderi]MDQ0257766.1 hypothetical protein [Evansella vedderi]